MTVFRWEIIRGPVAEESTGASTLEVVVYVHHDKKEKGVIGLFPVHPFGVLGV